MSAGAEADMTSSCARDVVPPGIAPSLGIAIGCPKKHQDFLALADTVAADIDILRRRAKEGLHRALKPDRLLKRIAGQAGIIAQPGPFLRKPREPVAAGASSVDGGTDTCRQQRPTRRR